MCSERRPCRRSLLGVDWLPVLPRPQNGASGRRRTFMAMCHLQIAALRSFVGIPSSIFPRSHAAYGPLDVLRPKAEGGVFFGEMGRPPMLVLGHEKRPKPLEHQPFHIARRDAHPFL